MQLKKSLFMLICAALMISLITLPAKAASVVIKTKSMYTTQDVNARVEPTTNSKIAKVVPKNSRIQVIDGSSDTWYSVWMDSKIVYIYGGYVSKTILPSTVKVAYVNGKASNSQRIIRTKANAKGTKIGVLSAGEKVSLTKNYTNKSKDKYFQIIYKNQVGYVEAAAISFTENKVQESSLGIVANNGTTPLKIRKQPTTSSDILGTLKTGDVVVFAKPYKKGTTESWYQIKYQNKTAYVSAQYIKLLFSE